LEDLGIDERGASPAMVISALDPDTVQHSLKKLLELNISQLHKME
jgi:hypothetical protein